MYRDSLSTTKIEEVLGLVKFLIPHSSTRESLKSDGYPESGDIEQTIRSYQGEGSSLYEQSLKAMITGCGNCQEMAYAGGLLLRAEGFSGTIQIGEFGINHAFLMVEEYIVDPWSDSYFPFSTWKNNLKAYGGSVKEGVLKGRVLNADHFELEDEEPEVSQSIPIELNQCLVSSDARTQLRVLIDMVLLSKEHNSESEPDTHALKL